MSERRFFDTTEPRHPEIEVQLSGTDGNAGAIMGKVTDALKAAGYRDEVAEFRTECMSGDYNHLLQTCMRWVGRLVISADQSTGDFPVSVGMLRGANGETMEFFLKLDGKRVVGTEIWLTGSTGSDIPAMAAIALRQMLAEPH